MEKMETEGSWRQGKGKGRAKERKASRKFNAQFVPHCCFRCQ